MIDFRQELRDLEPLLLRARLHDTRISSALEEGLADEADYDACLNKVMGAVLIANVIVLSVELDYGPRNSDSTWEEHMPWFLCETLFIVIFMAEVVIRATYERARWIRSGWNVFDAVIVVVAILETWILPTAAGVSIKAILQTYSVSNLLKGIRLFRLLRIVKLARMYRPIMVTVAAIKGALGGLVYLALLCIVALFFSACFVTQTIGHASDADQLELGPATAEERFGSIPRSMFSLFEIMTMEDWHEVGYPLMQNKPLLGTCIIFFLLFFSFGLVNMVVATVVESTLGSTRKVTEEAETRMESNAMCLELLSLKKVFDELSAGEATMNPNTFAAAMKTSCEARHVLEAFGIPCEVLLDILTQKGNAVISMENWMEGCSKVRGYRDVQLDSLSMRASIRRLNEHVRDMINDMEDLRLNNECLATSPSKSQTPHCNGLTDSQSSGRLSPFHLSCSITFGREQFAWGATEDALS